MALSHLIDQPLHSVVAMKMLNGFGGIEPGAIHPEMLYRKPLDNSDQAAGVIIVRMGDDHMIDVISGVIRLYMFDDGIRGIGATPVHDMEGVAVTVIAIPNDNRIAVAVTDGQEVNFI